VKYLIFVVSLLLLTTFTFSQTLIMNEVSNGPAGNQEYVEFVVIDTVVSYNCNATTPPCIDIRGWIFDDNSGYHGTAGIAAGAVRFSFDPMWACVPLGTIIVIYNDADPNVQMPANDVSMADGNCTIIAPISSTSLFERNTTTPGAIACSYPTTGWIAGGAWSNTLLANPGDCARIVNLAGCEVFSVCWGAANQNTLIYFNSGGSGAQNVWSFNDGNPQTQSNWTEGSAAAGGNQTPGAPNNAANAAYISQFNNGCLPITPIVVTATSVNAGCACTGSATATANGSIPGYTYTWYNSSFAPIGQTSATATNLCAGTYNVIATSSIGCPDTTTVTITSTSSTTVSVNSQTICTGNSTTLTATPSLSGGTYLWSPGGQTTQTISVNPTATTVYTVTYTLSGCTSTNTGTVTVNPLPSVIANDVSVCATGSTSINASGAVTYTWSPATFLSATTGSSVTFTPGTTTTYTVTGTNANGCISSDAVTVSVLPNAPISAGIDVAICAGGTTTLNAIGGVSYSWNNSLGVGNNFTVSPTTTTTYTVIGTDAVGCIGTDAITITVNPLPIVNAGSDQTICAGAPITLTATGAATYSWNNGVTNGVSFSPSTTTTYTVTGTSAEGCIATDQVTISVNPLPLVDAGTDQIICAGASIILNGSGATAYSWNNGVTNGVAFVPSATTLYTVIGTDVNGCVNSDQVLVTVNPLPIVNAGSDQAVCIGSSVTLTASGASTYSWNNGVTNGVSFVPTSTTTYTVIGTSAAGCIASDQVLVTVNPLPIITIPTPPAVCVGSTVALTASGASTYSWDNGITQSVPFTPTGTTTYTVNGTSVSGCVNSNSVLVTVNPLPLIDAGNDQLICSGANVTLTAAGATSYTWNNGISQGVSFTPSATTLYTVIGTDVNGCVNSDQVLVTVNPLPIVNAGSDQAVCIGSSVTLTASGASTYSWNNGVTNDVSFVPASTTTYTVIGTSAAGCIASDQVLVTVNPLPIITIPTPPAVCVGSTVTLTASGASTYSWDNGITQSVPFTPAGTITYTANGTSASGCVNSSSVLVTVNPLPLIDAGSDQLICSGENVTLSAAGAATYSWNNGISQSVSFTPSATTLYTVIGTDVNGCVNSDQVLVTVNPLPIVNAGADLTICFGTSISLSGSGAATYTWNNGVTNNTPFTPSIGSINYTVTGTSSAGCIATDQVLVTVNPIPTPIINGPTDYCVGFPAILSTSIPFTTYNWSTSVTTATTSATAVNNPITVTVTNTFGCTGTSSAFLVNENLIVTANSTQTICQGESIMIHGIAQSVAGLYSQTFVTAGCDSVSNVTLVVNPLPTIDAGLDQIVCTPTPTTLTAIGAATYTWDNAVTNGVPFTQAVGTTIYSVSGTDANGCVNTDQVSITVNPLPIVNAGTDQAICIGASVTLIGSGATSYTWNNGVTNATVFTPALTNTYTVTGTDANGCINSDQVLVTVNPLPTVNAGIDQAICSGSSVTLTGAGASNYSWDNGITNTTPFTPTITTTYTLTGTDANGCINSDQVLVTVNPLPTIDAGLDQIVCTPTPTTLTAIGAATYTWDNAVTNGVPFTQAVGTTVYSVSGTDANGCVNTDQVSITVNPLPIVNAGADQAICIGDSVTLTGSGATSYTWNNGVTNATVFTPTLTNTYTVTGTDANGCINSDQVLVTVNPLPTVNAGIDQAICSGGSVSLTGAGASNYSWDNGITNTTPFTPTITTTYTLTGTDVNGCINSDQVLLTVNPLPTIDAGLDQIVCTPTSTTLTAIGAATYTWDNGVVNGVPFTQAVGTTIYSVSGTDANGCVNTDQVSITVNPLPIVDAGTDQAICIGASVTLTGSGATSYTWNNGVTNATVFTPALTNTYTVTGTDANGCINSDQVLVTVNPLPTVNAGIDQAICSGGSISLTGAGASIYSWDNGITNTTPFTPTITTTYTLTGTDVNGCINSDQVLVTVNPLPTIDTGLDQIVCTPTATTLTAIGAATYTWDNGVVNGVPFTQAVGTTVYSVSGTDANGCVNTDQVSITVNPLPIVNAGTDQAICIGASVTLTGSGATSYTWNNGFSNGIPFTPTSTQIYTLTGTSTEGCIGTDEVLITVYDLPIVFAGNDIFVCEGSSVILSASGATTYTWDNAVVDGQVFTPSIGTNTYTVSGINGPGCVNTDQVQVTVEPAPIVNFTPDITSGCAPLTVNFTNNTANAVDCIWTIDNGTTIEGCNNVSVTFTQGGCYDITLNTTSINGCAGSSTAFNLICIEEAPNASFSQSSYTVSEFNSTINFDNSSIGATNYIWDFGDQSGTSSVFNPIHNYTASEYGSYTISLVASSSFGCTDTAYSTILMVEELIFYVPNTFTPDGDIFNQIFKPVFTSGFDPFDYTLLIFNRWGEIIFESNNSEIGWDGSYGQNSEISLVQDGVYTWKIEFKTSLNDERIVKVGHVNLLR
jgi:gliding motility-associated-like protein